MINPVPNFVILHRSINKNSIPVFFTQAVSGESLTIPSLTGELELKLDIGTKDKQHFT